MSWTEDTAARFLASWASVEYPLPSSRNQPPDLDGLARLSFTWRDLKIGRRIVWLLKELLEQLTDWAFRRDSGCLLGGRRVASRQQSPP
jgi:hypothetical protein